MKKNLFVLLFISSVCLSNISAKVRYQKVTIYTDAQNEIYIDGELSKPENGKYLLAKTQKTHIIIAKREGYIDDEICAVPYMSNGYAYASSFTVGKNMKKLPKRPEDSKYIRVDKVAFNVPSEDYKIRYFPTYNDFVRKKDRKEAVQNKSDKTIEYNNTIFSSRINRFLSTTGYVDTTDNVFKNGYSNNLTVDFEVTKYTSHIAPAYTYTDYGGMLYVELEGTWTLTNVYDEEILTQEATLVSNQLGYNKSSEDTFIAAVTQALSMGVLDLIETDKLKKALNDKSSETEEKSFANIQLSTAGNYASSLAEAIKASVTVKSKDSHGSGFFISNDGYLITNYHVITEAEDLKIIGNDQKEYDVEVVRVSKIHDLALLKIEISGVKAINISKIKDIEIASDIFAVGTPEAEDLSQTISKGIISGVRKTDIGADIIQTDASINSGNSGGAIVNKQGVAIGVVSSKLFGYGVEGVGFGIPAYTILESLNLTQ